MTLVTRKPPHTPRPVGKRPARSRWGRVAAAVTWPVHQLARLVVLWPVRSAVAAAVVTAVTPVTAGEVTGAVVGGCAVLSVLTSRSTRLRESLHQTAKYRKRRNRIRRHWVTAMADCSLARPPVYGGPDKRRPRIRSIRPEPLGVRVLVDGRPVSAGVAAFEAVADKLRVKFGANHVKVEPCGVYVAIHLRYEQAAHFGFRPVRFRELHQDPRPLHVTTGKDEDSRMLVRDLRLAHLWIGAPGAGKSSEIWAVLAALLAAGTPFRLWLFDPKRGMEFGALEGAAWLYERLPYNWPLFLARVIRAIDRKQDALRARGVTEVTNFTAKVPLDLVVIDELLTAIAFGAGGQKVKVGSTILSAERAFLTLASTIRSGGGTLLAGAQVAQKDDIGTVRDMFPNVSCLRVAPTAPESVDIALGRGMSKVYEAHRLSKDRRLAGIGFHVTEDSEIVKYRGALLTAAERAGVVRGITAMTKALREVAPEDES